MVKMPPRSFRANHRAEIFLGLEQFQVMFCRISIAVMQMKEEIAQSGSLLFMNTFAGVEKVLRNYTELNVEIMKVLILNVLQVKGFFFKVSNNTLCYNGLELKSPTLTLVLKLFFIN